MKSGGEVVQGFGEFSLIDVEFGKAALHDELGNALGLLLQHLPFLLLELCNLRFDVVDLL